jgi:hypothetical protein
MANNIAFQEMGKTVRINVSTNANTVAIEADSPCNQLRIHNGTAAEVFIPVAGTPNYGMVLHNNATVIVTAPRIATVEGGYTFYVSGIVASSTAILYVTPGEGL